ncbi:putative alcohol dehydrogenase [Monocercomonoides exilis]|uniref:putative alcohol dehydrogenase n=1 Tax=Monocercomonoides exilis TaxID=2049356 RepID=UPI00355A3C73|nr:putative alcohol dehydrogenase [Monocercomonoides exilis]KAH7824656.1 putative alcohol dehydrogenase [Monocercomonoides exilis]|eukprot:MONOS_9567.1-p1 / transcript=MONOS_9567.1 / gene=MONOS_9567 / organism=Monocercomonoides_exilis_PA203 / gene_product=NADH-dependent butanol dehydrogenase a / transcript_product=NADH-dependent butanol dehydrogenase a / location=Mono_scaffold00400:1481-2720(+) / protein_length=392 / sequence_SO=supercontig / SO=protein_coding / is_pseudo=false
MSTQTFYNPVKYILGAQAVEQLAEEIKKAGIKKVLLLFGSGSAKTNGVHDRVKKAMAANGISDEELWGVQPNPLISKIREGVAICKDTSKGIEAVVAIGGGSVIDSAKAICAGAKMTEDVWKLYKKEAQTPSEFLPLYTVLTISATASEMDTGSVVSNPEEHAKLPAFLNFPVASAVDPAIQLSLPWRQIMCGAVDSMSHLMEQYFSPDNKNITTRQVNLALQKSLIRSMERIKANKDDIEARTNFCWAVSLAIQGLPSFLLPGDWNVHWIEHAISAFNDKIAHGEGLAVVSLAYYPWLYKKGMCGEMFEEWAETVYGTKDVKTALEKLKELFAFWGTPMTLQDLKLTAENIEEIVKIEQAHQKSGAISGLYQLKAEDTKKVLEIAAGVSSL